MVHEQETGKMRIKKRRLIPVMIALLAVIAVSGVAYAYWTSGGSGGGDAKAGTPSSLTVNQTNADITGGLYPGGPAQALSGDFDNPNAYSVYVTSVTATVASVTPAACDKANFVVGGTSNTPGLVPTGNGKGTWSGLTVQLKDTGVSQDECKGATVHLSYLAS
jgi:hypothetical protein